ncbi:MAG TPA: hypothetical protein VFN22_08910 [Gemmatimonadales bacterium]|nr:hypothetical protein [Gemmatimonadales bacterium]
MRAVVSGVGVVLAVLAIAADDTRLTWAAIGVLAVAVALRFGVRREK